VSGVVRRWRFSTVKTSWLVAAIIVAVVVGVLGWFGHRLANATDTYNYHIKFDTLPASDDALREWLASRPGITSSSVGRDRQTIVIEYTMPTHGGHPQPDPIGEAKRLGYAGLRQYTGGYERRW
jgi:hypothetical protein